MKKYTKEVEKRKTDDIIKPKKIIKNNADNINEPNSSEDH